MVFITPLTITVLRNPCRSFVETVLTCKLPQKAAMEKQTEGFKPELMTEIVHLRLPTHVASNIEVGQLRASGSSGTVFDVEHIDLNDDRKVKTAAAVCGCSRKLMACGPRLRRESGTIYVCILYMVYQERRLAIRDTASGQTPYCYCKYSQ